METIMEYFRQTFAELLGRVHGPLHFRLAIMPIVAATVAHPCLMFQAFFPGQALIVTFVLAMMPYLILSQPGAMGSERPPVEDPRHRNLRAPVPLVGYPVTAGI